MKRERERCGTNAAEAPSFTHNLTHFIVLFFRHPLPSSERISRPRVGSAETMRNFNWTDDEREETGEGFKPPPPPLHHGN